MSDDIPECEDHAHLPVRLEKIKEFYDEAGTLIREDIEYLIGQAEWAVALDRAGQNLKRAAERYITELEAKVADRDAEIRKLTGNEK
jgi:hypothetical protein